MVMPGEIVGDSDSVVCCQQELELEVLLSGGGYYIGYFCPNCGPYSRESGYYANKAEAHKALREGTYERL